MPKMGEKPMGYAKIGIPHRYPMPKMGEKPMGYAKIGIPHAQNGGKADGVCQNRDTPSIPHAQNGGKADGVCQKSEISGGDLDLDLDPDPENFYNSDGGGPGETKPVATITGKPPPQLFEMIKEKVKAVGFYIDATVARKIAKFIPYPVWITDRHSIIEFAAETIRKEYPNKPEQEQKRLFISALAWDNIHEEYPVWLNKQIKVDNHKSLECLRNTPPKTCPKCGTSMTAHADGMVCSQCKGMVEFDKEKKIWKYTEYIELPSFKDILKNKAAKSSPDEVDF
jgi:ribosomal protein S27AE